MTNKKTMSPVSTQRTFHLNRKPASSSSPLASPSWGPMATADRPFLEPTPPSDNPSFSTPPPPPSIPMAASFSSLSNSANDFVLYQSAHSPRQIPDEMFPDLEPLV
ncbi:hypothetical protein DM01DRAFT_1408002 [Hesseltinella vesiculosa]|uniref:Uncharacterized protein n=1 Tax=Hesseltinella vesiculosa TaxID=101127 RepID=A0A1X2GFH7_9FUNG|nr:hypothetical protein DM01DRAFT_1408002 [Hesseltinella vesiculosa]